MVSYPFVGTQFSEILIESYTPWELSFAGYYHQLIIATSIQLLCKWDTKAEICNFKRLSKIIKKPQKWTINAFNNTAINKAIVSHIHSFINKAFWNVM